MTVVELVQALEKQMRSGLDPHAQVRIVGNQRWWSVRVEEGGGCVLLVAYDEHDPDDISTIPAGGLCAAPATRMIETGLKAR